MCSSKTGLWRVLLALLAVTLVVDSGAAWAQGWQGTLQDGRPVQVDPRTNRITVTSEGGRVDQLWDGAHRLQDGTTITTHSGIVVPNRQIWDYRHGQTLMPPKPFVVEGPSPCEVLKRKVCGFAGECRDAEGCDLAGQLLELFNQEQNELRARGRVIDAGNTWGQCSEALADRKFFPPCQKSAAADTGVCRRLVDKVCGVGDRCGGQESCDLARQLQGAIYQERLTSLDPRLPTYSEQQCQQALRDRTYFPACQ